jgi:hypothetical protein
MHLCMLKNPIFALFKFAMCFESMLEIDGEAKRDN